MLHHDLCRGARILLAEFETRSPALEIAPIQFLLFGIFKIGLADNETIGGQFRVALAQNVVKVETLALRLGAKPLPGERGVTLARLERGALCGPASIDILNFFDVDASRREHRIHDRLPAGAPEDDRLALKFIEAVCLFPFPESDVEDGKGQSGRNGQRGVRGLEGGPPGRLWHNRLGEIGRDGGCLPRDRLERRAVKGGLFRPIGANG